MKLILALMTAAALLCMSACNTVKGVGQDLKAAGEKIENAVKK
jgi:predicted small secreted protein